MENDFETEEGCFFFIEMEINPKATMMFGTSYQQIGAYVNPEKVHYDFAKIVNFINGKFPGSSIVAKKDVCKEVPESVEISTPEMWISKIQISCIDHRGETKH
jgi:hypothetical protein